MKVAGKNKKRDMLKLYESSIRSVSEGEIVSGKVIKITDKDVIVDVGLKSEGVVPLGEFKGSINVGDEIDVLVETVEDEDGLAVFSKEKADFTKAWNMVKKAYEDNEIIEGKVMKKVKGGMMVDLAGINAFLPGSQIDPVPIKDMDVFLGENIPVKVIKLNWNRKNVVVSRRAIIEATREERKKKAFDEVEVGQIREGIVKNITEFGAFVDIDGIDGLLHVTDMSWGRISHPSEVVTIGDTLTVKVLSVDKEAERLTLGLKQIQPYPWDNVEEKYPVGSKTRGKVVSLTDYGAFIEIEKGVEGLAHISEMSWTQHIKHPSQILAIGDVVDVVVLNIDKGNEKLSLGLKQAGPDPWLNLEERFPVRSVCSGKVKSLANYGAFIELEPGIYGLCHISELSLKRNISHPSQLLKKGQNVEVRILDIDKKNRRISLSLQQSYDPWKDMKNKFDEGKFVRAVVKKLKDRGIEVELKDGIDAFVPLSRLKVSSAEQLRDRYRVGDKVKMKVIEVIPENRRIILSEKI